jgi:hypothetical protein
MDVVEQARPTIEECRQLLPAQTPKFLGVLVYLVRRQKPRTPNPSRKHKAFEWNDAPNTHELSVDGDSPGLITIPQGCEQDIQGATTRCSVELHQVVLAHCRG